MSIGLRAVRPGKKLFPISQKSSMLVPMSKKKQELEKQPPAIDETVLFENVKAIIEQRKDRAGSFANREVTLMY
jgi:hypothetical protein